MFCTQCGGQIPDSSMFCPHCGNRIRNTSNDDRQEATGGALANKEIMLQAKGALRGKWGLAIGAIVVFYIITFAVEFFPYIGWLGGVLISGPMTVGISIFALALSRGHEAELPQVFWGFRRFGVSLGAYLLYTIIVFLWSLLLIIPGMIAALSYSQTFMIIADDDSIGAFEALERSKAIMNGNRWKFFCLGLRFIGWELLCILTLGIGFLWLIPYMMTSYARFYDDINVKREPVSMWTP